MARSLLVFLFLVVSLHMGILFFRSATGKERWNFVKTLAYSAGLSIIALVVLFVFVILF